MSRGRHWQKIYHREDPTQVGWYQAAPELSLRLIRESGIGPDHRIIDVGGGASKLVDNLLDLGFAELTVFDLSEAALATSRERLGERAEAVSWVAGDVTTFRPDGHYDLWHDRAVLHFLTRKGDRIRYRDTLCNALKPGGVAIIGTFALGGARRCAGLWVRRYGESDIRELLVPPLRLVSSVSETHVTPGGIEQPYSYFVLRRDDSV